MSIWTLIAQILNFIIFVAILYYLLYRPVKNILRQRRDEMETDLREAEKEREEAGKLREEAEEKAHKLEEQRDAVLEEAEKQAESVRAEILEQAEQRSQARLQRFRNIIEQERSEVLQKVSRDLKDTIVKITGTVLADASDSLSARAVERLDTILGEMQEDDRKSAREFLEEGNHALIRTASPLDAAHKKRLAAVLSKRLGVKKPGLEVKEDPSLVAGIEASLGHVNVEAHWRDVIEQALKKELSEQKAGKTSE